MSRLCAQPQAIETTLLYITHGSQAASHSSLTMAGVLCIGEDDDD